MDWDLKTHPWGLAEQEHEAEPNLGSLLCSSSVLGCQTNELDCSIDLKLGGLGDFGSFDKTKDQVRVSMAMVSTSSKRARVPSNGIHNASCLVDGCNADLSNCREYHRRHKVCEAHSKMPIVLVNGQEQRFCQQCSRFHLLVEFDEVKRSCRKRLDGHNRRRRKPPPDTVNTGSLFVNHQGPRFSNYSQIFPTTSESNWEAVMKTEKDALCGYDSLLHFVDKQQHFPGSFPRGCREGKQFAFLQESDPHGNGATETSLCQPPLNTIATAESSYSKFNVLTRVFNSNCALSLLSSPTQTSGINLSHIVPTDQIPIGQPLVSSLHQYGGLGRYSRSQALSNVSAAGFSCSAMEEPVGAVLISEASDADLHCQSMFHLGADGTSDGASQAIPYSWQ